MDIVTLLEKYFEQQISNDYVCEVMNQDEIHQEIKQLNFCSALVGWLKFRVRSVLLEI